MAVPWVVSGLVNKGFSNINIVLFFDFTRSKEKSGQWKMALSVFSAMLELHVEACVISYSAAINACEKGKQLQQAFKLFDAANERVVRDDLRRFLSPSWVPKT